MIQPEILGSPKNARDLRPQRGRRDRKALEINVFSFKFGLWQVLEWCCSLSMLMTLICPSSDLLFWRGRREVSSEILRCHHPYGKRKCEKIINAF